jgi:hypothetical protein
MARGASQVVNWAFRASDPKVIDCLLVLVVTALVGRVVASLVLAGITPDALPRLG